MNKIEDIQSSIIDICGKGLLEYMCNCLSKLNRGAKIIIIRAIGENINKAVELAHILFNFNINIESTELEEKELMGNKVPCLKIVMKLLGEDKVKGAHTVSSGFDGFVEFPVYHLLLDSLLCMKGKLSIFTDDNEDVLLTMVSKTDDYGIKCSIRYSLLLDRRRLDQLESALYRCGLLVSPKWSEVAKNISQHDDIILGLDTDIIMDAVVSEQFLSSLSLTDLMEYVHTPNWLLIVVPAAVMHEIEINANSRDEGRLTLKGRLGYRALQEIFELESNLNLPGVSLIITGEANPILDTRVERQGLRSDIFHMKSEEKKQETIMKSLRVLRMSSGDMIIRDQFKQFLRQISFHKGVYFLTADKSNAALARTEGLNSIYYKKPRLIPHFPRRDEEEFELKPPEIPLDSGERITIDVPLGKLVYELAVQFGSIKIRWDGGEIRVKCDMKGESLDRWVFRDLFIDKEDLQKLLENYENTGKFLLSRIISVWNRVSRHLYGVEGHETAVESVSSWRAGHISKIKREEGYGFVYCEDDGIRYFFYRSNVEGIDFSNLEEGSSVEFIPEPNPPEEGKSPRILKLRSMKT
jgi:DNA-binding protein/cold shock CspA family protein